MTVSAAEPGWYYAQGDPPGTQRYWDGTRWNGDPVAVQVAPAGAGGPSWGFERVTPVDRGLFGWSWHVLRHNYANFSGRARRKEYWSFQLVMLALMALLFAPFVVVATAFEENSTPSDIGFAAIGFLFFVSFVIFFVPALAVAARRLHDTDKSAWWLAIGIIPIVNTFGGIVLFIFFLLEGTPRSNRYGPDPKGRG